MNPILFVALVALSVIILIAISLPFIKQNATKDAFGLWDEPTAPKSDAKAGD